jgi:hypothetical protein
MAVTVEVGLDLSANDPTAYFTLDDFTRGVLDNATYPLGGDEWVDVTSKVRSVRCTRGRSSSLGRFTAATGQVVLDNRDRHFDPSYAPTYVRDILAGATFWIDAQFADASQTVPNLGTGGTALDARLGSTVAADSNDPTFLAYDGTPYVYLPGASTNRLSVPSAGTTWPTGDAEFLAYLAADDWTPGINAVIIAKFNNSTPSRSLQWSLSATGLLNLQTSADGTTIISHNSTAAIAAIDGTGLWVKATIDVDNGAAGHTVRYFTATGTPDTVPSSLTQLGADVVTAGVTSLYASTTGVEVGISGTFATSTAMPMKFYRAIVKDGIDGTTVLDIDTAANLTSGAATSFTAKTGQTVTINRSTSGRKAVAVVAPCWLLGTDDYMEVADNALLDFGASDSFTVLAVYRPWATLATNVTRVAKKANTTAATQGWLLGSDGTTGSLPRLQSGDGAAGASATGPARTAGTLTVTAGVRNVTADTLTTYMNGAAGTPVADPTTGSLANADALRIGRLSGAGTSYSDFELVAVAVFRRALTAAEISAVSTYYATRAAIPGTATIDRIDAVVDGTGSPYYGSVVPRKPVRIKDGSDLIALLRAERWDLDYSLSGDSLAVLALADSLGDLATTTLPAIPEPAEPTGTRITAILDAIDWPSTARDIDTGRARLAAETVADGTNAAAYLQKVEASEPGALFVAKDGSLTFRDRAALQDYSDGIAFGTDLPFTEPMQVSSGADDLTNRAIVVWSAGTATVDNTTAQARYGVLSRTVDTLLETEADAEALGSWLTSKDATPRLRVESLTVHRHGLTSGQATSLHSLDIGSPVGVTWTPNNVGDDTTQRSVVDQITHDATAGGTRHTVTFALSPANAGFLLDDADFGVLDTSALGF